MKRMVLSHSSTVIAGSKPTRGFRVHGVDLCFSVQNIIPTKCLYDSLSRCCLCVGTDEEGLNSRKR